MDDIKKLFDKKIISNRLYNILLRNNIDLDTLKKLTYKEICMLRNSGRIVANEVVKLINQLENNSLDDLIKNQEIIFLKNRAKYLNSINKKINNSKVTKLLTLALNKACSFGELRNCVTMSGKILNITL